MSIETQELGKIFTDIQSEFHNDDEIQVTPVSGDPPNQYEVTFSIPCTALDEQGNISITSSHTVIISIPFGFPHFPPSCKPKSSIFHPDFDTAAICLSDFWNHNRSIPELIRHIANMIRGEIYSIENAFNEDAAEWFKKNSDQLPFSHNVLETVKEFTPESLDLKLEIDEAPESDILEDQDFVDDFDFSDDFSDDELEETDIADASPNSIDFDTTPLNLLVADKRFNQLHSELITTYKNIDFPDKSGFQRQTERALSEARSLYEDAEDFENRANSTQALECYRSVQNIVSDYPNIQNDINRVEQSADLLNDFAITDRNQEATNDTVAGTAIYGTAPSADKEISKPSSTDKQRKDKTRGPFFEDAAKKHFNIIPYVIAGGVFCIVGTFTYFYFSLSSQLTEARQYYSDCTSNFAAKNFQAAEKSCSTSLDATRSIFVIHQNEVAELQANIRNILNSEEMRQGLLGNVLYNEKYVSKSTLAAHRSLQELKKQGNTFLKESAWDEAAANFQKAIELSRLLEDIQPDELLDIEQKLKYSAFRSMLSVAEGHIAKQEWENASKILQELQGQISALPAEHQTAYSNQISTLLAQGRYTNLKDQANKLFSKSDWAGAASLFQKAAEAGMALSVNENQELADIQQNIVRAELYSTINEGNSAFSSGQWDSAIEHYQTAIRILSDNQGLSTHQEIKQNIRKLKSIILQSAIIRDRQISVKYKDDGDDQGALLYLKKVITTIQQSEFVNDTEFNEILSETKRAKNELEEQIFINSKKQYLLSNYLDLFLENYPAATRQTLSSPVATFEKKLNNRYIFKLQCTESGRGRPLKLIMFYTYNPNTDTWSFYSEE